MATELAPDQPTAGLTSAPARSSAAALEAGVAAFGVIQLALAVMMALAPHTFYRAIGPFPPYNAHYIRDVASFEAALGIALLMSLRRVSWRAPVLAVTALQYGLHSVNHLIDIGSAHPAWAGYFDFFSLALATLALIWLYRLAAAAASERDSTHEGGSA